LPEQHKLEAFFNCWTRKEAYIKACGDGLSQPLDKFEVSLAIDEPAQLLSLNGSEVEASRWHLHGFVPATGYVAALAVEGGPWKLVQAEWPVPGHSEQSTPRSLPVGTNR
jgi:4'-phosphopantetheinyl transferase